MSNIAIFFTNKEYANDDGETITLEDHLYNVEWCSSTPDFWDSFAKLSKACKEAEELLKNGHPCLIVDLSVNATDILETFE